MGLTNENVGPKILAKIKIYVLTRAELLFKVCYEIPCRTKVRWRFRKILWPSQNIWTFQCRWFQPEFSTTIFRSDEVLSVSTSNLSGNSVPALIRHGSETSLPTNLWSQRASVSIDSEATEDDEADRRGSLVNESSPRRGSKLLDFLDKKKKDKKRYKDKQGNGVSDLKACRDYWDPAKSLFYRLKSHCS